MDRRANELVVGVPWGRLHAHAPRGVVRLARNVIERLSDRTSARLVALSDPVYERADVLFECEDMADWLPAHPLTITDRPDRPVPPPPQYRSLRDVDAIVSFECFDPVWEWPLDLYGCRMVGVCNDLIPLRIDEGRWGNPGRYYRTLGRMATMADSLACISKATQEDLERVYPSARGKTWLWYPGADAERFVPPPGGTRPPDPHPLADRPGRKIAMIGDVEPRKNQSGVLRACRYMAADHPGERLTLCLVGSRPAEHPYPQLSEEAARDVDVEYAGYVPDHQIGDLLRRCDVFVYPSLWEGFGLPVLEAMFAGVPVVCADLSSLPEVAGPHAVYCDPHDPRSIAAAVRRVLTWPPRERAKRVADARKWAARFSWDRCAAELDAEIARIAAAPRRVAA